MNRLSSYFSSKLIFSAEKEAQHFSQDFSSALSEDPQKILHGGETDGEAAEGGELRLQAEGDGQLPQVEEPEEQQGEQGEQGGQGGEVPAGATDHLHRGALCGRPQAGDRQRQGAREPEGENRANVCDPEIS